MLNNIFFQPFVGKDYADGGIFGKRIMILGESHYCDEGCADCGDCRLHRVCMGFTQGVLRDYLDEGTERQNWMRTFVKFERSLVGEETDQAMRLKIWNSVVFFNYLQVAMGGPREAGTSAQYRQAGEAFFEVINKYQPEYVIAWGNRPWDKMPGEHWQNGDYRLVCLEQWQAGKGNGSKPSLRRLFMGLLVQSDQRILFIIKDKHRIFSGFVFYTG